jgi:hypothetical protein
VRHVPSSVSNAKKQVKCLEFLQAVLAAG